MTYNTETFTALVADVRAMMTAHAYGRLRTKLTKQGFSEIALFHAIATHSDDHFTDASDMVRDTVAVLEGCSRNMHFLNTSNTMPFLRGKFHQLRYGDLKLSEPKCPEQKGKFLCTHCYHVCDKGDRSQQKTTPHSCKACIAGQAKVRSQNKRDADKRTDEPNVPVQTIGVALATQPLIEPLTELPIILEELSMPTETSEILQNSIKLTEVIADSEVASVTVNCAPKDLHLVLAAINKVTN